MIWIATISLIIYSFSLWLLLKDRKYYDRVHALFYVGLMMLLVNDINLKRHLIEGFNFYAHIIISLYSLYAVFKHLRIQRIVKEQLKKPDVTFITWDGLKNLLDQDKKVELNLNNNKINTTSKINNSDRMVFVSRVSKDTIVENYMNDFYKKIKIKEGSCEFYMHKIKLEKHSLKAGDSIELDPMTEHWFTPNMEDVVFETICIKV